MNLATALLAIAATAPAADTPAPKAGTSLTVYSSADPGSFDPRQFVQEQRASGQDSPWGVPGFGVVKAVRAVAVPKGAGDVAFTDVAAWIDPTTVSFVDLQDPATTVLEQNFQFDLVSPSKLLERYVGQPIALTTPMGDSAYRLNGTLLSSNQGQLVVRSDTGVVRILSATNAQVELGALPGGLITKPTLVWKLSGNGGEHLVRTTYQTAGLTWRADYNLVLDATDTGASMNAWVTLLNLSGASYPDTELKLVAGKVRKIERVLSAGGSGGAFGAVAAMADRSAGFEEKELLDYHLYTLPRRTDVLQNSTQQLALFPPVPAFAARKELVLDLSNMGGIPVMPVQDPGYASVRKGSPQIVVSFENKESNHLGMPLPAGKLRVYKEDPADGTLEFVGEDVIDHTPRNETVKVTIGDAFDVVGDRTRTDFKVDSAAQRMTETIRVEVRNQKKAAQRVRLVEHLNRWSNWEITKKSADFTKLEASTVAFDLDIPSEGKQVVEYTVTYTW
jgi:hypothetical protein